MKILFITSAFAPYAFSESIVNSKLVMAFLEKGWTVHVISRKDLGNIYSSEQLEAWNRLSSITYEIDYPRGNGFIRFFDILKNILFFGYSFDGIRWARKALNKALQLQEINNYDVIISRSPPDISHLVAYHVSKKTGVPWIANWNDPIHHIWPEPYSKNISFITKLIYQSFGRKMISQATMNTFPSEELKEYFKKFFNELNETNTDVIPHIGFKSLEFLNKQKNSILDKDFLLKLCHAGNLSEERSPHTLFEAIVNLKKDHPKLKIELDFMGIESSLLDYLIRQYNLEENVKQIGSYSYFDAMNKMSEYDILIIIEADLQDAIFLPSKFVDYAQLNIPILAITSKNSCIDRLLKENGGGISVDVLDPVSIQNGLLDIYRTYYARQENTNNNSINTLGKLFAPRKIVNHYELIFNNLDKRDK
jgi:glycosyltransferase involved in cell wall biosynthesis